MDELLSEFEPVRRNWERQEDKLIDLLERCRDALNDPKLSGIPDGLRRELDRLPEEWKSIHTQLSKFGKNVEKKLKTEEFNFINYANGQEEEEVERAINMALLQHFYREGNFEVGDTLARELHEKQGLSVPEVERDLRGPFEDMHQLIKSLNGHDIIPAVHWTTSHQDKLGEEGFRLRFQLHCLAFIELLRKDRPSALIYARENLAPFYDSFTQDIEALLGALAYGHDMEHSPYAAFLYDDLWGETEDLLVGAYCSLLGMAKESALRLTLQLGIQALPEITRVLNLMKGRSSIPWGPQEELPINVKTPPEHQYHSIFVCPVLKSQSTPNNPPMLMSCGHVISQEALTRLSKGNSNHKIKCPYCPAEFTAGNAKRIYF